MVQFVKRYWLEILTLGLIAIVLLVDAAPSYTWINTDSDGVHYTYSAQWLYPSHKQSAPLYLLVGRLFLFIPFGTEFWRMALVSVVSGVVASAFIMLVIKHKTGNRWYGAIGALLYGGSALAISQNTIVEAYPLAVALCVVAYYFVVRQRYHWACVFCGLAVAVHPTALLLVIPMIVGTCELRSWKKWVIILPFFLFYLYVPITNRPPYMWHIPKTEQGGTFGFVGDAVSTIVMLTGTLAIYDFPRRLLDAGGLILVNFAVAGLIPVVVYCWRKGWQKDALIWMILVPAIYYVVDIAPQTYVYLQPTVAFGAIAVGLGLAKIKRRMVYAVGLAVVAFLAFNANYFDIGRTLDPNLSATKYYKEEIAKVPDGQILMPYYGWEWAAIYRYNKENDRSIVPVCIDTLISPAYQRMLTNQGVKFDDNLADDRLERQNHLALSIVSLNESVWTTQTTDARTYGAEVIPARGNEVVLVKQPTEPPGRWHWKPTNPYSIITGAAEIESWSFITMSNHNMLTIGSMILVVALLCKVAERRLKVAKGSVG